MNTTEIKFGNKVKDLVTGFEGIVTGEVKYMNGCEKWSIDGKWLTDKQQVDCVWVDKTQVIKVDNGITESIKKPDEIKGGPTHKPMTRQ